MPPSRILKVSGDNQADLPLEALKLPLTVRVMGSRSRDILGRKGSRYPASGVAVTFEVEDLEEILGAEGEVTTDGDEERDAASPPSGAGALTRYPVLLAARGGEPGNEPGRLEVETDASGVARVFVVLGTENGDWRVEARLRDPGTGRKINEFFRVICGVRKIDEIREANVGDDVPLKLELHEWVGRKGGDGSLRPLRKRVVFFRVVGQPYGTEESAKIRNRRDETDKNGVRDDTEVTLGDRAGTYYVLAEVEPYVEVEPGGRGERPGGRREDKPLRGIVFPIVAMDWFLVTVKVVSGAFLFLIGVRFLANGLLLILSPYVHLQSGRWRERRLPGYLGGVLSGATFQSWSTVASHLVSFANGGFLTARGGLFLLLGSSLGATVLPQVLSLELGFLTIPFLAAGLFCLILPRQSGRNTWAWVFLGGGLVLASWSLLTEGIDLLAVSESFREEVLPASVVYSAGFGRLVSSFAAIFFLGLGIGFLLRTSNLVVILGILLATHGVITPASGVPLIVGANVGSALMVFLRSLLKNREARKLAACGAVFHVLTALVVVLLCLVPVGNSALYLWLVEWLTPGRLFHPIPESVGHHLAMAHTLYHLLGGVAFLAAPRVLLRLAERLFPSGGIEKQVKPHSLDENLIPFASLAIRQVTQEVVYLAQLSSKSVAESFDAFRYGDIKLADQVARRQETIADVHRDVTRYLVEVGENQLSRHDACHLEVLQSATTEVVRIGECAEGLRDVTVRRLEEGVDASEDMDREFGEVYDLVMAQFDNIATLLERPDQRAEEGAMKVVERLAKYRTRLETQSRQRLEQNEGGPGKSGVEIHMQSLIYHQAFDLLFRIASHLAHVSQRMRVLTP